MRYIDLETWTRREHFEFFKTFTAPHFNMCANVDVTAFYPAVKQCGHSFTVALVYVITRAGNTIPEFRQRIRDGNPVEYEMIHPGVTILINEDVFTFANFRYIEDFSSFATHATEQIAQVKANPGLDTDEGRDDWYFMTAIPWVSFTSFMHPLHLEPVDSVPRFAWGKYFQEGDSLKMPLSVQGHHALMDGLHMGRFYKQIQELLDHPEAYLCN